MAAKARRGAAGTTALWLHSAKAVSARARRKASPPTKAVAVSSQQFSRSVRTQLATLLLGYSHRYDAKRTINLSVGAGLTRDTPDFTLTLRMPFSL